MRLFHSLWRQWSAKFCCLHLWAKFYFHPDYGEELYKNKKSLSNFILRAGLTVWWALRTTQRLGPIGKLDAEEEERGGEGCPMLQTTQSVQEG